MRDGPGPGRLSPRITHPPAKKDARFGLLTAVASTPRDKLIAARSTAARSQRLYLVQRLYTRLAMDFRNVVLAGLICLAGCGVEEIGRPGSPPPDGGLPNDGGLPPDGGPNPLLPGIFDGPSLRVEGNYTFGAKGTGAASAIEWQLERRVGSNTRLLQEAQGAEVMFDLPYTADATYIIRARDPGFEDTVEVQVFPANVRARFTFESNENPDVPVHIIVPAAAGSASRVLMVHHGSSRNADDYCDRWNAWVFRANYVIVCPEFSKSRWPKSAGYNLGNVFTGRDGEGTLNPDTRWAFTIAEAIYSKIKDGFRLTAPDYDIWGHSAGGQFVHRMLLFNPDAPVRFAMAANPGWYTTPELAVAFPYGLSHSLLAFTSADVLAFTLRRLIIMRGTEDTQRSSSLRQTPEADAQGRNRYERAGYMFDRGAALNPNHRWSLIDVPGVGHSGTDMAPAAMDFLEMNGE